MALTATGVLKKLQFNFNDPPPRIYVGGAAQYPNLQASVVDSIRSVVAVGTDPHCREQDSFALFFVASTDEL